MAERRRFFYESFYPWQLAVSIFLSCRRYHHPSFFMDFMQSSNYHHWKEGYPLKNFFSSFKINFKQSTLIWIGLMIIGFIFFTDFRIAMALENTLGRLMLVTCSCFLIPYLLICLYIFPVQAKFKNTIYDNLKNAFFMAIRHFPLTLLLIAIDATFILLFFSFVPFIGLALCCGVGLLGYLNANLFVFIFRKYVPDELEHDLEISGERF